MPSKKPIVESPIKAEAKYTVSKVEKKETLEFDPSKIKAGEGLIVQVKKWGGLTNQCFAVLNVDGKKLVIKQLKEENLDEVEKP